MDVPARTVGTVNLPLRDFQPNMRDKDIMEWERADPALATKRRSRAFLGQGHNAGGL